MCSKMAAKFTNSSDESSMGSIAYFSSRVFTENLEEIAKYEVDRGERVKIAFQKFPSPSQFWALTTKNSFSFLLNMCMSNICPVLP